MPYPDEIVGSIFARASYRYSLSVKSLTGSIFGKSRSSTSFLMTANARVLGALCGMDAEKFLENHTIFPYVTAFMSVEDRARLLDKALNSRPGLDCLGSLTRSVSHGANFRKKCQQCEFEDIRETGESYWRRTHQLPGVYMCVKHNTPLHVTGIKLRGNFNRNINIRPEATVGFPSDSIRPTSAIETTARISHNCLIGTSPKQLDTVERYSTLARAKGYSISDEMVASQRLSADLKDFFGQEFLSEVGCDFNLSQRNPWPTLMLRQPMKRVPFAAPKHILMETFLQHCGKIGATGYKPPGKKPANFAILDSEVSGKISAFLASRSETSIRFTVKEIFQESGYWNLFRHNRKLFPITNDLVFNFRQSEQSERKIGRRLLNPKKAT